MCGDGPIWALGAMSGTSLDGVDCALVRTDGHKVAEFGESGYRPYTEAERAVLRRALGQADGPDVEAAAEVVELAHAELLTGFPQAELIGFHGQTTLHQPDRALTVQIGNGALLAETLERPVVWDFRSADVHLGGQGAPLAPFYHFALAKRAGFRRPVAFLNIGGVANITWVDPRRDRPEADGALLAFDTGPGNALIDDLCMTRLGRPMDADGVLTRAGQVDEDVLAELLSGEAFFSRMPPKSLDRNDFKGWDTAVSGLSDADAVATLAAGTAGAVALALQHCPEPPERLLVTGGGRRNPGLMELIRGLAACTVVPVEAHGFDGDMLEAQAFAFLAVRVKRGLPTSCAGTTGVAAPVGGGRVSKPGRLLRRAEG
ncbi:anhydro-N-acetylmuramic acid kinase [Silicimonas algicola]|uniref:Anhydro-N-acetylmuramic acid kinase n=1 Tax=Silicimonas algicola TaxID=1826607 RepID=A0A316GRX8_9RHOB|nr:anhydro-N-acetylmuramic acid kinase [Silicimonas algicola]AZQ67805.1 anhydro-N-acetylmuramic acid kinase [Silicimonas algicola]PWK57777.1 anhydro-N-acetylmuramic acid kinase [Silicimonas algicola]